VTKTKREVQMQVNRINFVSNCANSGANPIKTTNPSIYFGSKLPPLRLGNDEFLNEKFFNLNKKGLLSIFDESGLNSILTSIRHKARTDEFYSHLFGNVQLNRHNLLFASNLMAKKQFRQSDSLIRNLDSLLNTTNNFEVSNARNSIVKKISSNNELLYDRGIKESLGEILYFTDKESKAIARLNVLDTYLNRLKVGGAQINGIEDFIVYSNSIPASDVATTIIKDSILLKNKFIKENISDILECANDQAKSKILNALFTMKNKVGISGLNELAEKSINIAEQEAKLFEGDIYLATLNEVKKSILKHLKEGVYNLE